MIQQSLLENFDHPGSISYRIFSDRVIISRQGGYNEMMNIFPRYHWKAMLKIQRILLIVLVLGLIGAHSTPGLADVDKAPFRLPFLEVPGPGSWLLVQPYGNTTGAYRQRNSIYSAGQGMHFGVDFSAPCGTPIVAIGNGVVAKVDALEHGSAPHNLMIDHANGYASFYGHLLERPQLFVGQKVKRGQEVAKVGDPDETCVSRPHLHLEIRNAGHYNRAYNPVLLIDSDWDSLALIGSFSTGFARDLENPHRWQTLYDQPDVSFHWPLLNDYSNPWPPDWRR